MNEQLWDELVGAIRRVRERYEAADPWQTWADEVLVGAVMTSVKTIEAAAAAGAAIVIAERAGRGAKPPQRIARAAWEIAHAAGAALFDGDAAAPAVKNAVKIVEQEIQSG